MYICLKSLKSQTKLIIQNYKIDGKIQQKWYLRGISATFKNVKYKSFGKK